MAEMTFNPDANPETTSVDGAVSHELSAGSGVTWATLIAAAGTNARPTTSQTSVAYIVSDSVTDRWRELWRAIYLFDTNALPSGVVISTATFSVYGFQKADTGGWTPTTNIYGSTPATDTDLIASDFATVASTPFCDTVITYANWDTSGFNDFILNTAGLSALNTAVVGDGILKLGLRNANYDVAGVAPSPWASTRAAGVRGTFAEQGVGFLPKLVVTYTILTVTTQTCEDVVGATATGRGNITVLAGTVTAHGHCWDTSINPTTSDSSVDNGAASATGAFTSAITGLTPGTAYYTRAFATNSAGTSYGANVYFIASTGRAGFIWMEGSNFRGFDENAVERKYIHTDDVDDTPVNGATTDPISSNWAFDHVAAADPHVGYVLESLFDAQTVLHATSDDTPVALTVNEQTLVGRQTGGNIAAVPIGITDNDIVEIDSASVADNDYAKFTAAGLEGRSFPEVLTDLSAQAGAAFDWNDQELDNIKTLNMSSATELTISSGAVTATQGHHSIDTEGDASTDDLDTINSLEGNDLLFIFAANGDRTVRIRDGIGNIFLRHQNETKSYSFSSPAGGSGTFYTAGFYNWSATDANLNQGSLTVTHGGANVSKAAHAGLVAGGAGSTNQGTVSIVVSGTSMDDEGNRSAADSETLVSDITAMSTDQFFTTVKKWLGTITYTLTGAGGASTFNADFNYGFCKYEDFGNQAFSLTILECVGLSGGSDSGFNIRLFHHHGTGWTYATTGFVPGGTVLANMNTDHSTEQDLVNGEPFAYKRVDLNTDIDGAGIEGVVVEITTGANKAVEIMDIHIGVHTIPKYLYLAAVTQHVLFMQHGGDWHQV